MGSAEPRRLAALGGKPAFDAPLYVARSLAPDSERFGASIQQILASRWFTNNGMYAQELERRLEQRLGVGFCLLFCNATVALQVALRALDLSGEVITTPFTFPATVHAVQWNGLRPVFCDIDPETYTLDPVHAAKLITPDTSALLPVHVFGNPCHVSEIEKLALDRQLRVIYDAAHCFDVQTLDRPIGAWGDLSVLSFHATKLFHTAEGGAIVGSDPALRERIARLRNFGIVDEETVDGVGLNGKISEIHAAIGLALIDRIDGEIEARGALTERYRRGLSEVTGVVFQKLAPATRQNHGYFSIEIDEQSFGLSRNEVHDALRAENVITRKYFYPLCSENPSYRVLPSAQPSRLPAAHRLAERILCLPLFGELPTEDVDCIVERIARIQSEAGAVRRALRQA